MRQIKNRASLKTLVLLMAASFLMGACGGASPEGQGGNKAASTAGNSASTADSKAQSPPKSNKLDACALVPKAEAETILGQPVKSAELGRVTEGTASTAAFSECTYQLGAPSFVSLFARRSPVMDNTPEAIKKVRDTMKEVSGKEAVDVAGLGDTAFWTAGTKQLHVFQGGNVYIYVTMMSYKAGEEQAKAKAVELARRAMENLPKQN